MGFRQAFEFWAAKAFILKQGNVNAFESKVNSAYELASTQPEKFMFDEKLMTFLYSSICNPDTARSVAPVVLALFDHAPKKSIARKNLMVTVRRMAIDGLREESQQAAQILVDKNDAGVCLRSVPFMEMIACIASFDIDGTVAKMLNHLEDKQPELCETIPLFLEARENNAESLNSHDEEDRVDLVTAEEDEKSQSSTEANQNESSSTKLWAGPPV